jgi:RNA polymerase sigma factor (sigma-70 family)
MTKAKPAVFIVDDDADFRDSMQWLLESTPYPVESFASAQAFLDAYDGRAGCMLLDVRMPEINGLALQQLMREQDIRLPVVIITGHGDVPMAVNAMKNGALDFIEKPFDDEILLQLVDRAMEEAEKLFSEQQQERELRTLYEVLSRREREVMQLVVSGNSNREIAETLGISPKTVEVHRSRVMSKMRAESLAALVQMNNRLNA